MSCVIRGSSSLPEQKRSLIFENYVMFFVCLLFLLNVCLEKGSEYVLWINYLCTEG